MFEFMKKSVKLFSMNIKRCVKNVFSFILIIFCSHFVFASNSENKIKYLKGNISDKIQCVKDSAQDEDLEIAIMASNFCLSTIDVLGEDEQVLELVQECVSVFIQKHESSDNKAVSSLLEKFFKSFSNVPLRISIINAFSVYNSSASVSLLNSYLSEKMQDTSSVDELLLPCIKALGETGNNTSFNLLFIADILDVWPSYSQALSEAYGQLSENSEGELLRIISSVPMDMKLKIINKISVNEKISKKILSEAAESAFSLSINNIDGETEVSSNQIALQLAALKVLSQNKWTRASGLANQFFEIARNECEKGFISLHDFAECINMITSIASSDTSRIMYEYLDYLNKNTEKNMIPDSEVVLAVINSLGGLGDKAAFDYLLYVTYLDYPENVITAARAALAKLKW